MERGDPVPASVYRRRRIVVLLAGLVAVALIVVGAITVVDRVRSLFASGDDEAASPAPVVTPTPTGTTEPTVGYADCAPPELAVTIAPDAADVPAGAAATFTITIANQGATDCVVDAGDAYRDVVIVSGSDRVWSSKDCVVADAPSRTLLLVAGTADTTQLAWNRERSAPGCPAGQPTPQPGTYQATVTLAGATGGPVVFRLG